MQELGQNARSTRQPSSHFTNGGTLAGNTETYFGIMNQIGEPFDPRRIGSTHGDHHGLNRDVNRIEEYSGTATLINKRGIRTDENVRATADPGPIQAYPGRTRIEKTKCFGRRQAQIVAETARVAMEKIQGFGPDVSTLLPFLPVPGKEYPDRSKHQCLAAEIAAG